MDVPSAAVEPAPATPEGALIGLAALCRAVDEASSAPEILRGALPILRSILGPRVALDLRGAPDDRRQPADPGSVVAPVVGQGHHFGVLRASGFDLDLPSARASASAAGRIVGAALALRDERAHSVRDDVTHVTPALAHRLHSSIATIGVAASTLRMRGDNLRPDTRDQLLLDIEANVEMLRLAIGGVTASGEGDRHDG